MAELQRHVKTVHAKKVRGKAELHQHVKSVHAKKVQGGAELQQHMKGVHAKKVLHRGMKHLLLSMSAWSRIQNTQRMKISRNMTATTPFGVIF